MPLVMCILLFVLVPTHAGAEGLEIYLDQTVTATLDPVTVDLNGNPLDAADVTYTLHLGQDPNALNVQLEMGTNTSLTVDLQALDLVEGQWYAAATATNSVGTSEASDPVPFVLLPAPAVPTAPLNLRLGTR